MLTRKQNLLVWTTCLFMVMHILHETIRHVRVGMKNMLIYCQNTGMFGNVENLFVLLCPTFLSGHVLSFCFNLSEPRHEGNEGKLSEDPMEKVDF